MEQSDQILIKNYLAGDDQAFEVLLKKYLKPVYNFPFSANRRPVGD